MTRKKKGKNNIDKQIDNFGSYSDENFAYISGYTSGGAPYGITWEQWEEDEENDSKSHHLPTDISDEDLPF